MHAGERHQARAEPFAGLAHPVAEVEAEPPNTGGKKMSAATEQMMAPMTRPLDACETAAGPPTPPARAPQLPAAEVNKR